MKISKYHTKLGDKCLAFLQKLVKGKTELSKQSFLDITPVWILPKHLMLARNICSLICSDLYDINVS